ncbi:Hypothetical predicted protein [Olea europaea subsp. europaea]|uniref:Uncharacterized protein n=1 Tax=Olea europaea subsp. europaea TaxID=158383 RepID=A0A8S0TJX0_OLEEU|nr:Hypothetical predicted protein [Olea europaea subsp. europaea]
MVGSSETPHFLPEGSGKATDPLSHWAQLSSSQCAPAGNRTRVCTVAGQLHRLIVDGVCSGPTSGAVRLGYDGGGVRCSSGGGFGSILLWCRQDLDLLQRRNRWGSRR